MLCGNQGHQCHVRNEKIPNISARNQIEGTVVAVKDGAVNSHVTIKDERAYAVLAPSLMKPSSSWVSRKAAVIIKSTNVMVAVD